MSSPLPMSLPMLRTIERRHGMAVLAWNGDEMDVVETPPLLLFSVQGDSEEWLSALQHLVVSAIKLIKKVMADD